MHEAYWNLAQKSVVVVTVSLSMCGSICHAQSGLRRAEVEALIRSCNFQSASSLGSPSITIQDIRESVGMYKGLFRVRGVVEGVCLADAGVYVDGKKRDDIRTSQARRFNRFTFESRLKSGDNAEVRATNSAGETVRLPIALPKNDPNAQKPGVNQLPYMPTEGADDRSPFDVPKDSWDVSH